MSVLTPRAPSAPPPPPAPDAPRPLRWTREEYYRLADAGFFRDRRVMLIEGEILAMSPQNEPHARGITLTDWALAAAFGPGFWVRNQCPLDLGLTSDPEPDLAVVPGSPRTNTARPTTALLVVEVADTSLAYDTGAKANLYAAGGIADYWVVDLANNRLHVFRDPQPDPAAPHGHRYAGRATLDPAASVTPLAAPASPVKVADLLP